MKIKLLNGQFVDQAEMIEKMRDDDFYYGEMGTLAHSSSSIKQLLDSPKTYRYSQLYGSEQSQAMRDGWLLHCLILEPEKFAEQEFVDVQSKNTKAYREAKLNNPNVFTIKEKKAAERLADALLRNEQALSLIGDSEFEVPALGVVDGYAFRGKADILKNKGGIVDIKTTTDCKNFDKSAARYWYCVQVYIYCELFNCSYTDFKFLVIDKNNLDIAIADVSKPFYEYGREMTQRGLAMYETFFEEGAELDQYIVKMTL